MNSLQQKLASSPCWMVSGGAIALRRPITALPHTTGRPADRVAHDPNLVALSAAQLRQSPTGSRSRRLSMASGSASVLSAASISSRTSSVSGP